jgi:hypothetical protein
MRYRQIETAIIALTTIGILTGCGTVNGTTSVANGTHQNTTVTNNKSNTTSTSYTSSNTTVPTSQMSTSNSTNHASTLKSTALTWFLHDVQLAERINLKTGTNYMLNWGEGNVPSNVQMQMNQLWFGVPTNIKENPFFGYSWSVVYQAVITQSQPPMRISVLEQSEQGSTTIGVLVSAKGMTIDNGDFVAFANGQVITATDKSGELFYTVCAVKDISVPSS